MKKRFIVIIIIIVIIMSFMIRTREIGGVKFNNRGDKVFITYRYPDGNYKLFLSNIHSKKEQIIYEGEQCPTVIPNPKTDILLYSYDKDTIKFYNYKMHKLLFEISTDLLPSGSSGNMDKVWHPGGNQFFFISYKGLQVIEMAKRTIKNLTQSSEYPIGKNHESYDCLSWSSQGDVLYYSKGTKIYGFNSINNLNQEMFEVQGDLLQVEPTNDKRYIIYLEEPEVEECYIGIYDLKNKIKTRLYRMAGDGEGDKDRSFGLDISNLHLTKDNQIIFSVCEFDDTNAGWGFYDETAVYRLNPFTKELKKLTKYRDTGSVWDYNKFTNTIVVKSGKNQLKFIEL